MSFADPAIRTALTHHKVPEEFMEYERMKQFTGAVTAALDAEKPKKQDGPATGGAEEGAPPAAFASVSSTTGRQPEVVDLRQGPRRRHPRLSGGVWRRSAL